MKNAQMRTVKNEVSIAVDALKQTTHKREMGGVTAQLNSFYANVPIELRNSQILKRIIKNGVKKR